MARTILTTLTAKDYKDLKQNYSEKNIINQTNGNEYVISTASKTDLTDIHGESLSRDAVVVSPDYPRTQTIVGHNEMIKQITNLVSSHRFYLRDEWYFSEGSFSIETDEVISDPDSVSVKYQIRYDKYVHDGGKFAIYDYDSDYAEYKRDEWSGYKENDSYLTSDMLPLEHSKLVNELAVIGMEFQTSSLSGYPLNRVAKSVEKLNNSHYKITVAYSIVTWWGFNNVRGNAYTETEASETLLVGRYIDFTISANTVEAKEMEFNYSREVPLIGGAKGKNYEIMSNEFLQTQETTATTTRKSSILSNQIFDKFDTDRTIVSFVLLNCEKYVVDNEYRYLRAEDLIYIKDENGEYLKDDPDAIGDEVPAVFEVIKTRPVWNGSFEIEVTCRKVDSTT